MIQANMTGIKRFKVTPNFRALPSYCIKSQTICHRSHTQNSIPNQQSEAEILTDQFFIGQPMDFYTWILIHGQPEQPIILPQFAHAHNLFCFECGLFSIKVVGCQLCSPNWKQQPHVVFCTMSKLLSFSSNSKGTQLGVHHFIRVIEN